MTPPEPLAGRSKAATWLELGESADLEEPDEGRNRRMPRRRSSRRKTPPEMESYIFELRSWQPKYLLAVDRDRYTESAHSEYAHLAFEGECVHPLVHAGRVAGFTLASRRDFMAPTHSKKDLDWKPNGLGVLELSKSRAEFYTGVPHETLVFLMNGLALNLFRYALVFGPPLKRGKSLCTTFEFLRDVNLEDY